MRTSGFGSIYLLSEERSLGGAAPPNTTRPLQEQVHMGLIADGAHAAGADEDHAEVLDLEQSDGKLILHEGLHVHGFEGSHNHAVDV